MQKRHLAAQLFDKFALQYQEKYMDVHLYHDGLVQFCQRVRSGAVPILDVGCGPGNVTRFLLKLRPEFDVLGIDLAPTMVELARKNNPGAQFEVMDALDINALEGNYAGIVIGFCLPYLSREEVFQLLQLVWDRLEPAGCLYLSTMEGKYEDSAWSGPSTGESDRLFTFYHDATYLTTCLKELGYMDVEAHRQEFEQGSGEITWDLVVFAKKPTT